MSDPAAPRPLHLHGRRRGRRLRPGRRALLAGLLPRLAIALPADGGRLDPAVLFPAPLQDLWLEIGFGAGEHLADQAAANPEVGIIGSEIFLDGIAGLLGHVDRRELGNVRIYPDDARPLMDALPDGCLGRVFLLFPDPWPKARHAGRRFVDPHNLDRLSRLMRPGAELRVASDDPGHVAWILEQTMRHAAFRWLARRPADWRERPADWPATRYEMKARSAGRPPAFLRFARHAGGDV